jgi:hypothetical protein
MERFVKKLLALPPIRRSWAALWASRNGRHTHPTGTFDTGHRWHPDECEDVYASFFGLRRPTARYPYSFMHRARTKAHCKLLTLAMMFSDPGYVPPADANRIFYGHWSFAPNDITSAVAEAVLPAKWRADAAARTLALDALRAYVNREGDDAWDWHAAGVLADYLADRGETRAADAIRAELPSVAVA